MTTKPHPKTAPDPASDDSPEPKNAGAKRRAARMARRKERAGKEQAAAKADAKAVQGEGLSGQQLRAAMRLARRHGLQVKDAYDAVRLLRESGIDLDQPANPLRVVVDNTSQQAKDDVSRAAPTTLWASPAQTNDQLQHEKDVQRLQASIARRRFHKMNRLALNIYLFFLLPTLTTLFYFAQIATPIYSTNAEFIVQSAGAAGGGGGIGALFTGTALGSSQEAIAAQRYIESKEAMLRLDAEHGFIAHFNDPSLDYLTRIPDGASIEDAFKVYKKRVKVGYDPTEGLVILEVMATTPETAVVFADALISYAEEVVNNLTARQRNDQLNGAEASFQSAEAQLQDARRQVLELQQAQGIVSADAEVGALMQQIATFELQVREEQMRLEAHLDNPSPNAARVASTERNISRLEATIAEMRADLTTGNANRASLVHITNELAVAQSALAAREVLFHQALEGLQTARAEADRQVRYLALNVAPVQPEEAAYPRVVENTAVAFLIFVGIYLIAGLTMSVLREQIAT